MPKVIYDSRAGHQILEKYINQSIVTMGDN
jgi:hypothetical protein